MARLTNREALIYEQKVIKALKIYKYRRKIRQKINIKKFIKEFDISKNGQYITGKNFSNLLRKYGVVSQQTWKQTLIKKSYIYLYKKKIQRTEIVK